MPTMVFEVLGEGDDIRHQWAHEVLIVEDPGGVRAGTGENTGAGGVANGDLAISSLEQQTGGRQTVQVGGLHVCGSVAGEVGTKVVHGDEEDVGRRRSERAIDRQKSE